MALVKGTEEENLYTWESPGGSSLKKSVNYVVPCADGTKTRKEWANTKSELDRLRAAAGIEAYRSYLVSSPSSARSMIRDALVLLLIQFQ